MAKFIQGVVRHVTKFTVLVHVVGARTTDSGNRPVLAPSWSPTLMPTLEAELGSLAPALQLV